MALSQDQITQFTQRAQQAGYSQDQIDAEISRKQQEVSSQNQPSTPNSVNQGALPSDPSEVNFTYPDGTTVGTDVRQKQLRYRQAIDNTSDIKQKTALADSFYQQTGFKVDAEPKAKSTNQGYTKQEIYDHFQTMKKSYDEAAANPLNPNAYNNYAAQRAVMSDITAYGLTKSRAWQTVKRLLDTMPNPRDINPLSTSTRFGSEGAFKGLESQLNTAVDKTYGSKAPSGDQQQNLPPTPPSSPQSLVQMVAGAGAKALGPISDFLIGGSKRIAQDVGAGIGAKMDQPSIDKLDQQATKYEQQAQQEKDPQQKRLLLQNANQIRSQITSITGDIGKSFSPDVTQDPLLRAATGATEIAGTAGGANIFTKLPKTPIGLLKGDTGKEGLSTLSKLGKYLTTTKGKTVKEMEQAVAKGGKLDWETILKDARSQIANKGVPAIKQLERLINQETPAQLGSPKLSASQGFELRKGLGARLPSNIFETALQKASTGATVPQNQAIKALRSAVSNELKRVAPDIKTPDAMYAFIKKMHGDAPTWGKRIAAGAAAKVAADKLGIKGPGADFVDLLIGGAAGLL